MFLENHKQKPSTFVLSKIEYDILLEHAWVFVFDKATYI